MEALLESPVYTANSLRSVNFFNGRLLSAEDLNREKASQRQALMQAGRAAGEGIAYGLDVAEADSSTASQPRLRVTAGLCLNRNGRVIELVEDATVSLRQPATPTLSGGKSSFEDCTPPQAGVYLVNTGIYILTVAPAEQDEGRAPVSGLGATGAECNVRYKVQAVQFRLLDITTPYINELGTLVQASTNARPNLTHMLRNRIAHDCLGTGRTTKHAWIRNPFGAADPAYGLLDDLRDQERLTACEVPLAVLLWTASGLAFVDMWSVRRRVTVVRDQTAWWPTGLERRTVEAEAAWLQFQQQVQEMLFSEPNLAAVDVSNRFRYLPAAGYLPSRAVGQPVGFDLRTFLGSHMPATIGLIETAQVRPLLQLALTHDPIDLGTAGRLRLYRIITLDPANANRNQPDVVHLYTSELLPNWGAARFTYSSWNGDRFSV